MKTVSIKQMVLPSILLLAMLLPWQAVANKNAARQAGAGYEPAPI